MAATEDAGDVQMTCRFSTKLPAQYRVPASQIAVPAKLTRYGLSQIINHLLALDKPVPFDFLVGGELIRLSLQKFLLSQNISAESVLDVEYIFAVTPPDLRQQLPHDDWVGAVDGSRIGVILSGCYDGVLKIWNGEGEALSSTPIHRGPISSLESLPEAQGPLVLSGGKLDHVIRLLQVPADQAQASAGSTTPVATYRGHGGSVLDVSVSPSGTAFVSASQDKTLRIWSTGAELAAQAAERSPQPTCSKKKQKLQNGDAVLKGGAEIDNISELTGHSDAATSIVWTAGDAIYSGSMDHSVRKWDAETGLNVDTYNGRKAVSSIAVCSTGRDLVAFAGAANVLNLWDPRQGHAEGEGGKTFASHASHIHALAWQPNSEHHVVTASMDKTLKLWDLRAAVPLHTLEGHTAQVLCATWWEGSKIVSGSADNTVRVYKTGL